jgi:putative glutamine amidotransferase
MENNKPTIVCSGVINPPGYIKTYERAITDAGGTLLKIEATLEGGALSNLFASADGFLIPGGSDINPARYGQENKDARNIDDMRDELEDHIVRFAIDGEVPILGICRGLQVMNVVLGGSLYQDIRKERDGSVEHDQHNDSSGEKLPRSRHAHEVTICERSRLREVLGVSVVKVNSLHHQGIDLVGKSLVPVALTPDGLVEGIEIPDHPFFVGVQWHPEELGGDLIWRQLFVAFIKAARAHMGKKAQQ